MNETSVQEGRKFGKYPYRKEVWQVTGQVDGSESLKRGDIYELQTVWENRIDGQ